jgi:hypothetical protein
MGSGRVRRSAQARAQAWVERLGGNEFATVDFWAKHVVAQPKSDTADGVDEAKFWSTQMQFAAQVREVDDEDVCVADPVRTPNLIEHYIAGADLGWATSELL